MQYLDVENREQIPTPPNGFRYLDFLGGTKQLRCYLVPHDLPRISFLERHKEIIDDALLPVYSSDRIIVRQDASYALPGFYIVSLTKHYPSFDVLSVSTHLCLSLVLHEVRSAMRSTLGVEHIHMHYEEKPSPSCNVHFWLMPIRHSASIPGTVLTRLPLKKYLSQFKFQEERENILKSNRLLREKLVEMGLTDRERMLAAVDI